MAVTKAKKKVSNTALAEGDVAPDFSVETDDAGVITLSEFRGKKNVVLFFYPKDNTPGCTREACAFQEHKKKIERKDTVVIGMSPDSVASHGKFRAKFSLEFLLGSDDGHKVADSYGVWVEKKNYGKTYMGIQRSTFFIDKKGKVVKIWPKVSVDGHVEEVLEFASTL